MNIVVLDGHTLNPGDLSWEGFEQLGTARIYERTPPEAIVERAAEAEVVLTNKTPLSAATLEALPQLQYIGVLATGYNIVDVEAARNRGIPVTNVPDYGTDSVAQMTMALLLELTQHVGHLARTVREGRWTKCPDFCYWDYPLIELRGLALGIVGYGRIGQAVARLGQAFGMNVLVYTPRRVLGTPMGVEFASLDMLLGWSDVVSLHCPLRPETENLMNAQRLAMMKPTAFLLNTSRGQLVDAQALADALKEGRLGGAGLDVLAVEPPHADNPLLAAPRCYITPHIAWATRAARDRLLQGALENLINFLQGTPINVVNGGERKG